MASLERFHGVRVFQSGDEPVAVSLVSTSTIGLLIAVDPAELAAGTSLDTPILIQSPTQAATLPANVREEIDTVFDQVTTNIVVVMVDEGADTAAAIAAAVGDQTARTGIHALADAASSGLPAPKLWAAPGLTGMSSADGIASVAVTQGGSGYDDTTTVEITGAGTGAEATAVVEGGAVTAVIVTKPGYGYTGTPTVTINGAGTGATATAATGTVLNALIAEAAGLIEDRRAHFYADGPDGTVAQALAHAQLVGNRRISMSDPRILKSVNGLPTPYSSSTVFAALQAKQDRSNGPHWPASNMPIAGIQGTNRPVGTGTEATLLNEAGINTVINRGDGFIAWGPMTTAVNTIWRYVNVSRVADLVNESIEKAFYAFIDRPYTLANLDLMRAAGRRVLLRLEAEEVLLPGSSFDLANVSPDEGVEGIVKFAIKFEPPSPMYDIRMVANRNFVVAYDLIFNRISGSVDTGETLA